MAATPVLINPWRKEAFSIARDLTQTPQPEMLCVENTQIQVPVAEIFQELDSIE